VGAELAFDAWAAPPWRVLAVLAAEAAVGYPAALHRRIPHPVVWAGALISGLERRWNRPAWSEGQRRAAGVFAMLLVAAVAAGLGLILEALIPSGGLGLAVFALAGCVGLAQRSLYQHVRAVAVPLATRDLEAARAAVSQIVGRDVAALDERGVAAAGLESLAESFNDGVVAPAFWLLVGGLPGLFAYKAVNTADSLVGHREPRWRAYGWAAARLDDLMNLIPARLAGALVALAGGGGWRVMARDAPKHASPNAGWPEAAMAGALRRRLGGPAWYDGVEIPRPAFGDGPAPDAADLERGLKVYLRACGLLWLLVLIGGLAWPR
jgi:adenosylcobinamide-phosphate synthase